MRTITSITATAALGAAFVASFATVTPAAAAPGDTIRVTSQADAGPGTLREALEAGAEHIVIDPSVDVIEIASTLTGHTSVRIEGGGAVIDADAVGVALAVTADPGTSGVLAVDISHLTVLGAGDHGSYITDDQDGNLDAAGSGPPVPVSLTVRSVVVEDVGHAGFDRDGIRVDERDDGSLTFVSLACRFTEAGADGVELDETGQGGVAFDVHASTFEANGPLNPDDLDDGIDVDEVDAGDVTGSIRSSSFIANHDEGIDINEDGTGSIDVDLVSITVRDTVDGDGIAFEEHGDGDVTAELRASTSADNTGDGFEIAEDGEGIISAELLGSTVTGNAKASISMRTAPAPAAPSRCAARPSPTTTRT